MASLFVNSFHAIACTPLGLDAMRRHGLPPFIDGSIRREPDFEHPQPAISCLCRAGKFVPRLRVGDHVAYLTVKRGFGGEPPHRRLVAVLRVDRQFASHAEAARWFRDRDLQLPSNLVVEGNPPVPLDLSSRDNKNRHLPEDEWHRAWEAEYAERAERYPLVVGCSPLFVNVHWSAPRATDDDLRSVFGRVPGTQNPARFPLGNMEMLGERLGLPLRLPA